MIGYTVTFDQSLHGLKVVNIYEETEQDCSELERQEIVRLLTAAPRMFHAIRGVLFQLNQGARVFERDCCVKEIRTAYREAVGMDPREEDRIEDDPAKLRATIGVLREALMEITRTNANENSEPNTMADALREIQTTANQAIEITKEQA